MEKRAWRAKRYTIEGHAVELSVSCNTIGMIERRIMRPGNRSIRTLCDWLWIDRKRLLIGIVYMDHVDLTPFYDLLRKDSRIQWHIKVYINN